VGFKNELIGQSNSPIGPRARHAVARGPFLACRQVLGTSWKFRPTRPPPAGICRQPFGLGKVESWARAGAPTGRGFAISRIAQGERLAGCRVDPRSVQAARKAAINGISMQSYVFMKNSRLRRMVTRVCTKNGLPPWYSKAPTPRSSNRSSSVIC
jgi:hypothetical protein